MLCSYGCGNEGKYYFKSVKKWCCETHCSRCPSIKLKNGRRNKGKKNPHSPETRENMRVAAIEKYKDVDHRMKMREVVKNRKLRAVQIEMSYMLCSYGCDNFARYFFSKVKKWCCSDHYLKCPRVHRKTILNQKPIPIENKIKKCYYGCGQFARYKLPKSEKYCCSKNWSCCSEVKRKNSKTNSIKQKGENNARFGVIVDNETRRKIRLGNIKDMQNKFGQVFPNYNKDACDLIEEFGLKKGYNFQHAENGGEFFIKELGYWVDGYDKDNNVVLEVDEQAHFDIDDNLLERDKKRQKEIEEFLGCKFIRIKNL